MTEKIYSHLPADRTIVYTDRELAVFKYTVDDALEAARSIQMDRTGSQLKFADRHKKRYSLVSGSKLNISQHNAVIADVLHHEAEYSRRAQHLEPVNRFHSPRY
jgi:hypothetical protein